MIFIRKTLCHALYITVLMLVASCVRDDTLDNRTTKTVLVYMAADNTLSDYARSNVMSMSNSMTADMHYANLLVYVDRKNVNPALLHLHDRRIDTIKVYDKEQNSADARVLNDVIKTVINDWKAESYGLILWSHGMAWIPESQMNAVAGKQGWAPIRYGSSTKSFASKDISNGNLSYTCMEIDELAGAIPEGVFDYIAFDACYMGSVEALYALRKKAPYIISSSCEIIGDGFPYRRVTSDFLSGNVTKVCTEFFSYYNSYSGFQQTASISLVNTDGLDSLARCFKKIVATHKNEIPTLNVSDIQYFDRFEKHVMFDLEDFVDKLGTDNEDLTEFRLQLEKCVSYKNSTPYICNEIKMNSFCGLSVYIPLEAFEASGLNDDYRDTEWSKDTEY